jgi:large subunit ribosomal protein L19
VCNSGRGRQAVSINIFWESPVPLLLFRLFRNLAKRLKYLRRYKAYPSSYAPGGGRTHNLWLRRPTLYPVELRAQRERELATGPADFHRFSDVVLLLLALRARAQIVGDFGLQNPCLRMRVCARSRSAGEEFMNQVIDTIEKEQQKSDTKPFSVGDSVRVHTRVVEGDKERIQIFAGIVIGRKGRGINETFTVRRISYGEGVERVFPLHSPRVAKVEVEQQGRARRAKLNYLRTRKGKEATAVRE